MHAMVHRNRQQGRESAVPQRGQAHRGAIQFWHAPCVAGLLAVLLPGIAAGQIDLTLNEFQQYAKLLPPDEYDDQDMAKRFGIDSQRIVLPEMSSKAEPHILARDGRIIGVWDDSALKGPDIDWYLRTFTRVQKKKGRSKASWQTRSDLLALFPPLGDSSEQVVPILKTLFQVDTYRIKSDGAAELLYSAPFSKIVGERTVSNQYVRTALVMENAGMDLYALVSIYYARSNFIGIPTDYVSQEILLAEGSLFWHYMTQLTRGKDSPDIASAYEPMLYLQLEPNERPQVSAWRTAAVLLAATDRSSLSVEEVIDEYEKLASEMPDLLPQWLAMAGNKWKGLNAVAMERRTKLLGELGSVAHLRSLEPLLGGNQLMQKSAKAALRSIASRNGLTEPPDDSEPAKAWRAWLTEHAPSEE